VLGILNVFLSTNLMPISWWMRYDHPALAFHKIIILVLLLDFNNETDILVCLVLDGNIVGKELFTSFKLVVESINWLLHPFYSSMIVLTRLGHASWSTGIESNKNYLTLISYQYNINKSETTQIIFRETLNLINIH
jgi:hypothetical protein